MTEWQLRAEAFGYINLERFGELKPGVVNPFDRYDGATRHDALAVTRDRALYWLYLRSQAWRVKRCAAIRAAGGACEECGRSFLVVLDVHHLTYQRIGDEAPEDLMALCRRCHDEAERRRHADPEPCDCGYCDQCDARERYPEYA